MPPTDTQHAVYYRSGHSKRWHLHGTYPDWSVAMSAALKLDASAVWVTAIEPTADADSELTPAEHKQRTSGASAKSVVHTECVAEGVMGTRRTRPAPRPSIDLAWRWWLEVRPPGGKWVTVGTVGSRSAAAAWLFRLVGHGGVQIRKPPALVASLAAEG